MSKEFTMKEKADKGTILRTTALAITWANLILSSYDLQPIPVVDDTTLSIILAGVATAAAWFKNNYLTIIGRKQKKILKETGLSKAK